MKSNTLLCNRLTKRHIAEYVLEVYCETLADFKITEKIMHVVTDNASNTIKAFCLPGYDGSAFNLDSVNDESVSDSDVDDDSETEVCQPIEDLHCQLPTEHIVFRTHPSANNPGWF